MARIPTITSQVGAQSGRTTAGVNSRRASPNAFGAAQGAAVQALGAGMQDAGNNLIEIENQKRAEDVANRVAQSDFTRRELELRNEVGADGAGYQDQALAEYDEFVEEQANEIEDDAARQEFRNRMAAERASLSRRSATYEFATAAENSKFEANNSLNALDNKIRLMPNSYDNYVEQGFAVIDARADIPATVKAGMKEKWREGAALSRFEGMLESATTVDDIELIEAEIANTEGKDWTKDLSPAGLERILSLTDASKRTIRTATDAAARAAVDGLEGRAGDVTTVIPDAELRAAQEVVSKSENPVTQARMGRIVRDQQIIKESRRMTPGQQRDRIETRYNNPSLPSALNTAIGRASSTFGVSPAYLAATAKREYGVFFDGDNTDWTKGNIGKNSSATGPMQFIEDTFLGVMGNPAVQAAIGIDTSNMSRSEILALRGDVDIALMAGAAFTAMNAKQIEAVTGRKATDAELYMAHFMGAGGAAQLLRMIKVAPGTNAAELFPKAAKANNSVYYKKDGTPRTVVELYDELGRKHGGDGAAETYVEYGDRQTREKVLEDTEKRVADDPMAFASQVGTGTTSDIFSEGGMAARGDEARRVSDYYSIPQGDMKPFTNEEAAALGKRMEEGDADTVLGLLTSIQEMGGPMARAAMRQLGETDDVFAYAGGLQMETGQGAVAADIVKGRKRLEDNPDIKNLIGAEREDLSSAFLNATGGALLDAAPRQRQAILDAAVAHYVQTQVATGQGGNAFDPDNFATSVQAVMGARQGAPAIDEVNGAKTALPPGLSGEEMEDAFQNMTVADWVTMSAQGEPPRYITGQIAEPDDIEDEVQLRAIGGGQYRVMLSDGSLLTTGRPAPNGQLEPYILTPTADAVKGVNERARKAAETAIETQEAEVAVRSQTQREQIAQFMQDGNLTTEEQAALIEKYGVMWSFDENGERVYP